MLNECRNEITKGRKGKKRKEGISTTKFSQLLPLGQSILDSKRRNSSTKGSGLTSDLQMQSVALVYLFIPFLPLHKCGSLALKVDLHGSVVGF